VPRIRTIKPEFWDSPATARASLRARLFFIAMWNWADDYGIGTANGKQLVGFAFPNDDDVSAADYPRLASDVSEAFGVVYFEHHGRPFYVIPSWEKHQRTEKKAKPRDGLLEAAEAAVARGNTGVGTSADGGGLSDSGVGTPVPGKGTGEQGNRGKGTGERRATGLPLDWTPNPNCIAYAQTRGVDVNHEADQFRNHAAANGRKQLDWHASFRTWLGNARPRPTSGGNAPTRTEQNMAVVAKYAAIEGVQQKGLTP
jgi:hypothetical protein